MEQVPKIVPQRLQAMAGSESHPDSNLLAALAENSLTETERLQVLDHMARCAECRDIVAVALPESEMAMAAVAAASPMPAGARSGWLNWRVMRWGAAAACVIVVGAAVTLYRRASMAPESPRAYSTAELQAAASPPPAQAAQEPAGTGADRAVPPEDRLRASDRLSARRDQDVASSVLSKSLGRQAPTKTQSALGVAGSLQEKNVPVPAAPPEVAAAPPAAKSAELDEKASHDKKEEGFAYKATDQLADKQTPSLELAQTASGKAKDTEERAKLAAGTVGGVAVENRKLSPSESSRNELVSSYTSNLVLPRWTLSADGTLQRSFDAGKTWQIIPVPGKATWRALAAVGAEIWIGGTGASLYHSSDAGEHWMQVKPVAGGKALNADIIGVEFTDARHGKLTTADGEIWTTADAGGNWERK